VTFALFHADKWTDMMGLLVSFFIVNLNVSESNSNEAKFNLHFPYSNKSMFIFK